MQYVNYISKSNNIFQLFSYRLTESVFDDCMSEVAIEMDNMFSDFTDKFADQI